ncbi:unnamed protein product [Amoebophrya sp. A120]|nr:unnamed protein product [Amoebophrya sp. A120]|eukprot:GSA120T00000700001.1
MVRILASGDVVTDNDPRAKSLIESSRPQDVIELYVLPKFGVGKQAPTSSKQLPQARIVTAQDGDGTASGGTGSFLETGSKIFLYGAFYCLLFFCSWLGGSGLNAALQQRFGGSTSAPTTPPTLAAIVDQQAEQQVAAQQGSSDGTETFLRFVLAFHTFYDFQDRILFFPTWYNLSSAKSYSGRSINESTAMQLSNTEAGNGVLTSLKIFFQLFLIYTCLSLLLFAESPSLVFFSGFLFAFYKLFFHYVDSTIAVKLGPMAVISPYVTFYWVSIFGGILLYGYCCADRCFLMEILQQNVDPLCSVKQNPSQDLVFSFLLRLILASHFLAELQTKINHRQHWVDVIAKVPAFADKADRLMSLITTLLIIGCSTLICGNLVCDYLLPQIPLLQDHLYGLTVLYTTIMTFSLFLVQAPTTFMFEGGSFGTHMEVQSCGVSAMAGVFLVGWMMVPES